MTAYDNLSGEITDFTPRGVDSESLFIEGQVFKKFFNSYFKFRKGIFLLIQFCFWVVSES